MEDLLYRGFLIKGNKTGKSIEVYSPDGLKVSGAIRLKNNPPSAIKEAKRLIDNRYNTVSVDLPQELVGVLSTMGIENDLLQNKSAAINRIIEQENQKATICFCKVLSTYLNDEQILSAIKSFGRF